MPTLQQKCTILNNQKGLCASPSCKKNHGFQLPVTLNSPFIRARSSYQALCFCCFKASKPSIKPSPKQKSRKKPRKYAGKFHDPFGLGNEPPK